MKSVRKLLILLLALVTAISMCACGSSSSEENDGGDVADTIVYGNITTTSDDDFMSAQAMAIRDGKILYIGDKNGIEEFQGDNTKVKDYSDQYILPGFIDGHQHAYVSAENKVCDFNLTKCKNAQECVDVISKYVKKHPKKKFYIGYGWLDVMFDNGQPTADLLDAIDTNSPIYIKSEDCHSCWTNTAMMKRCRITKDTPDPNGGVVEHYASGVNKGEPSGCFRDTAMDTLIKPNVPVYSVKKYKKILLMAQKDNMKRGYTAYNDVIIDEKSGDNIIEAYKELDQEGKLKCYINASYILNNNKHWKKNLDHIKELADGIDGDHFALTDVKFFMDGITESCTAYMEEPYLNNTSNYGVDRWSGKEGTERLNKAVAYCNDLGLVAHFHAIGDAAVSKALDAAEYAKENSENTDIRNVMTHIQFMADSDIQRFKDLNMIASADLGWCYTENGELNNDPNYQNIEFTNLGEERESQEQKYESLYKAGVTVAFATDFPATSNVDPFKCLEIGTTRMTNDLESTTNNAKEGLTMKQALRAITINSAIQLQREDKMGSLESGKQANFIVVNKDIMNCDGNDIYDDQNGKDRVAATYIDGKCVYKKAK